MINSNTTQSFIRHLSRNANRQTKKSSIDKLFPSEPKKHPKEWEKRGISKDEFFIKKYSFMSDDQKKKLQQKNERQQRAKSLREQNLSQTKSNQSSKNSRSFGRQQQKQDQNQPDEDYKSPLNQNPFNEYVYGRHSVLSALSARKRHLYDRLILNKLKEQLNDIISMSKKYGIKIDERGSKNDLNILTNNGVHNGVVLETRKLELPELISMGDINKNTNTYELQIWNPVLNTKTTISKPLARNNSKSSNPVGIYLDEITDPQNVGAIIRTAFFLGADFIVTPAHNSARLGPVTSKASAGALDLMDIYQVHNGLKFMRQVKQTDWTIITTDVQEGSKMLDPNELSNVLSQAPVLLVLGSEGSGVRTNLKTLSDFFVNLEKNRVGKDNIVDSLNVSTATSILLSKLLQ